MHEINIFATVLILLHHAISGSAVDPTKVPMVLKEGRQALHPGIGTKVVPKAHAPVAPPPPHLYNDKVSADTVVHDPAPPPPPPHVYNENISGDKTILHPAGHTGDVKLPTPTVSASVLHHPNPLPHADTQPHVSTGPQVHPKPHRILTNPLPPRHHAVSKVGPSVAPYAQPHPDTQTHPKVTSGQGAPQFNKGNTNSLSFSSSSADGPGSRQCSFTVSNPNTFQASSDGFGYPKFQVEGAANNNPLAKQIFQKYREKKNSGSHFALPAEASRPTNIPGFGARHIPAFNVGGQQQTDPQDLDVNAMFSKIGKHASDDGLGSFPHEAPSFPNPDSYIRPGRRFGSGTSLQSAFQRQNPFGFGNLYFRKKRQAINLGLGKGFKNQLQTVCPSKSDYIRVFKKYNSACYLYEPELQGHKVAKCTQKKCSHCGGSGRCVEEKESALVWAYCPSGPNARKLELEYIEYPAYCVCKTIQC